MMEHMTGVEAVQHDWSGSSATTTHSYSSNGTYVVKLRVTDNDGGSDTCTKQITISNVVPVAVNDTAVTNEDTAVVINISINDYDSDGSIDLSSIVITSAVSHGSIDVNTNGTVTYTPDSNYYGYDEFDYTIKDNDGVTSNIATVTITINGVNDSPVANFSYSPPAPTTQITVHFADLSSDSDGFVVNWTWNFGDGAISYQQNPSHQYADDGTYNVTLTVRDNDGATDSTFHLITVSNVPPTADFSYTPLNPTDLDTIQFTDLSSDSDGFVANWIWDFGDGNISYEQNPTHQYADDGMYNVTLTVTDDGFIGEWR